MWTLENNFILFRPKPCLSNFRPKSCFLKKIHPKSCSTSLALKRALHKLYKFYNADRANWGWNLWVIQPLCPQITKKQPTLCKPNKKCRILILIDFETLKFWNFEFCNQHQFIVFKSPTYLQNIVTRTVLMSKHVDK